MMLALLIFATAVTPSGAAEPGTTTPVREAIRRTLPFVESYGAKWMKEQECASCHVTTFMTWSFAAAERRGFDVDDDKLDAWTDWSIENAGGDNHDGFSQLILGRDRTTTERDGSLVSFAERLVAAQEDDGSWSPTGQLPYQKRPKEETAQVTTTWIALALGDLPVEDERATASRKRAVGWLRAESTGESTEWYATRLLLAAQNGEPTEAAVAALLAHQRDDGGWGWLVRDPSDALATGQSLYALGVAGVDTGHEAVRRALDFLVETQRDDGSWLVLGTKEDKKEVEEETAVFWGATWAAIGMLEVLGPVDQAERVGDSGRSID